MQEIIDKSQLRKFGLILSLGMMGIFGLIIPFCKEAAFPTWPYFIGFLLFFPILFAPSALKIIYLPWMKLGAILGWINTRIILGIIFYGMITPLGLVMRLLGKDLLNLHFDKSLSSYRKLAIPRPSKHMENPY